MAKLSVGIAAHKADILQAFPKTVTLTSEQQRAFFEVLSQAADIYRTMAEVLAKTRHLAAIRRPAHRPANPARQFLIRNIFAAYLSARRATRNPRGFTRVANAVLAAERLPFSITDHDLAVMRAQRHPR